MNSRVQRSKDFVFSVLGPFLGQNMPIFAGCATLFLLMASFPLLIWVLVIVNHLPGYSITDVADLLYQFLPQVPEIQDVILEVLYGLNTQSTTFVASFAAVTMLYSASSGMYAIQKGLQRLTPGARYKLYDRLLAILYTVIFEGLLLAVLLQRMKRAGKLLKSAFLLPVAVPAASVVLVWKTLFHSSGLCCCCRGCVPSSGR